MEGRQHGVLADYGGKVHHRGGRLTSPLRAIWDDQTSKLGHALSPLLHHGGERSAGSIVAINLERGSLVTWNIPIVIIVVFTHNINHAL